MLVCVAWQYIDALRMWNKVSMSRYQNDQGYEPKITCTAHIYCVTCVKMACQDGADDSEDDDDVEAEHDCALIESYLLTYLLMYLWCVVCQDGVSRWRR